MTARPDATVLRFVCTRYDVEGMAETAKVETEREDGPVGQRGQPVGHHRVKRAPHGRAPVHDEPREVVFAHLAGVKRVDRDHVFLAVPDQVRDGLGAAAAALVAERAAHQRAHARDLPYVHGRAS